MPMARDDCGQGTPGYPFSKRDLSLVLIDATRLANILERQISIPLHDRICQDCQWERPWRRGKKKPVKSAVLGRPSKVVPW